MRPARTRRRNTSRGSCSTLATTECDVRDRVTVDSIRNHCARHFPVQNAAKAVYREIIERRAKEAGIDFVNGVTTALTPVAYFETILVKSFESLKSDVKVDVATGMTAASRLQAFLDSHSDQASIAEVIGLFRKWSAGEGGGYPRSEVVSVS
jgi:hypothetical protein